MVNLLEFILLIILGITIAIFLILLTGIIYTKDGYVSIIEKKKQFYKFEQKKFTYYFPLIYKKAFYYPLIEAKCKLKDKSIVIYKINDISLLYQNKIKINKLIKNSKNLQQDFKTYKIELIKIEK